MNLIGEFAGTTTVTVVFVLALVAAYFIGNISPSTIMAKRKGMNIKEEGSGNAGTTNALRVMGKKAGVITLVIDILKGFVAAAVGGILLGEFCMNCCGLMVVIGHVWPMIYGFKGGKGVATIFGAALAINQPVALISLGIVAIFVFTTKRMSVGSIAGGIGLPILAFFLEPMFFPQALIMAVVAIVKHRANIVRLIHGEEPKMSIFEKKEESQER